MVNCRICWFNVLLYLKYHPNVIYYKHVVPPVGTTKWRSRVFSGLQSDWNFYQRILPATCSLSLSLQRHQVCPSSCWCRAFFHSVLRELDGFAISSFLSDGETMEPKNSAPKKTRQANIPAVLIHKHLPRVLNCPKYARYTSVHKYICMYMLLIHKSQLTTSTHEKTHYQKMAEDLSF